MSQKAGLWIDHRKAVIMLVSEDGEELKTIDSSMEKRVRFSGGDGSEDGSSEDVRDRKFGNHLNNYYDEVIAVVRNASAILIFGPGEAKMELDKRLEHAGLKKHVLPLETVDKMTEQQISSKVREHFSIKNAGRV
ncbi:MAG: hypothetical protein K8S20_01755 [Chloroflexi bacterium]|nr:hypothetical protein [Chloroflexota bacterium]